MVELNIKLTDELCQFVTDRAGQMGHASVADYLYELIREDRALSSEQRLEKALLAGLDSGDAGKVDDRMWQRIEQVGRSRLESEQGATG